MERERSIENYGKKEQKEWLDNTLPDPHPCTAGNKEEEHMLILLPNQNKNFPQTGEIPLIWVLLHTLDWNVPK